MAAEAIRLGPGGVAARPERTRQPPPARPVLTQAGPGTTAPEAAGVAPAARRAGVRVWGRGARDREQGRHYYPPPPAPGPQPRLEPRLGPPGEGRRRGAGGAGGAETGGGVWAGRGQGGRGPLLSRRALQWELPTEGDPAPPSAARVAAGGEGSRLPVRSLSLSSAILCGARCLSDDCGYPGARRPCPSSPRGESGLQDRRSNPEGSGPLDGGRGGPEHAPFPHFPPRPPRAREPGSPVPPPPPAGALSLHKRSLSLDFSDTEELFNKVPKASFPLFLIRLGTSDIQLSPTPPVGTM